MQEMLETVQTNKGSFEIQRERERETFWELRIKKLSFLYKKEKDYLVWQPPWFWGHPWWILVWCLLLPCLAKLLPGSRSRLGPVLWRIPSSGTACSSCVHSVCATRGPHWFARTEQKAAFEIKKKKKPKRCLD
jgi:hypothetical protein